MAIDTVVQFADDQLTRAKDALTAAGDAFAAATNTAQEAAAGVADIGTLLAAAEKKGRELQAAPRPTAGAARDLAEQQARNEVVVHALTARLSAAREAAAVADALQTEAQTDAAQAQARLDERQRLKQSADADAKEWEVTERAVQAVRDLPVSIPDAVDAIKASASYQAAETRVNEEVPQKLRVDGRQRAAEVRTRTKKAFDDQHDAVKAVATKNKAHRGKSGDVAPARLEFVVSRRLVRDIAGAAAELDQIKTRLEAINAAAPLIAGAVASITDLEIAGKKAITDLPGLNTKVDDAVQKVADQEQLIRDKEAAIAATPAPAPADLQQLQDDLDQLELDLPGLEAKVVEAQDDYREAAMDLDLWEAAVPDAAWQRLLAFDEISRRLAELKAKFTPAKIDNLRDDLKDAEKELVKAFDAEAVALREIEVAELDAQRQHDLAAVARELYDMNQLAAIRGDA